ncbi:7510_t:CDS:2, partial [Dentiscutata erythropus]
MVSFKKKNSFHFKRFEIDGLGYDSMSYGYPPYRNYRKYETVKCGDADSYSLKYSDSEQ